jgi:hypothetical protein
MWEINDLGEFKSVRAVIGEDAARSGSVSMDTGEFKSVHAVIGER